MPAARKTRRRPARPKGTRPHTGPKGHVDRLWALAALGIIVAISAARSLHLGFPLERDEGEFGYIAQQLLNGVPVYVSAHTQKLPGTYIVYALSLAFFGQSSSAIHFGLMLANALVMALLFLTLRKTHSALAGCVGTLIYGVMAMSPNVVGFAAHATVYVTLFAIAGTYVYLLARARARMLLFLVSGLCFGTAFLMKQSGVFFAPVPLISLALDRRSAGTSDPSRILRQGLIFTAGALTPFVLTLLYYTAIGELSTLWFWAFQFAGEFAGHTGTSDAVRNFTTRTREILAGFEIVWIVGLVGFVAAARDAVRRKGPVLFPAFAIASVVSVLPGLFFTNHYFVPMLAAIALLIGGLAPAASRQPAGSPAGSAVSWITPTAWTLTALGLLLGMGRFSGYYFGKQPDAEISHWVYHGNPFPESVEIGDSLRSHTTSRDQIAMLGSETQILFYAQRRSASHFVNTYFLRQSRAMQREMIADIERARPKYVVFARLPMSWSFLRSSPSDIFDWFDHYRGGYQLEGVLLMDGDRSAFAWGKSASAQKLTPSRIEILRRVDTNPAAELFGP